MKYNEMIKELENGKVLKRISNTKTDSSNYPYALKKENETYFIRGRFRWNKIQFTEIERMLKTYDWEVV